MLKYVCTYICISKATNILTNTLDLLTFHYMAKFQVFYRKLEFEINIKCHPKSNISLILQGEWNNVRKKLHGYFSCTAHTLLHCLFTKMHTLEIIDKKMNNDKLLSLSIYSK